MTTENLSTLKIHKLTQTQYDRELANDNLDKSALYLTPDEANDLSLYATIEQMNGKADVDHTHTANEVGARPNTWMPTAADVGAVKANSLGTYTDTSLTVAGLVKGFFDERIRWGTFHAAFLSDLPPSTQDWDNGIEFRVLGGYWVEVTITAHNHGKWTRLLDTNSSIWKTDWKQLATTDYALPRDGSGIMTGNLNTLRDNAQGTFGLDGDSHAYMFFNVFNTSDWDHRRTLMFSSIQNSPSLSNALVLGALDDGTWKEYPFLHTGNYGSLMAGGTISGDLTVNGTLTGTTVKGAIWNDYAEYRESDTLEPGRVVCENGDDTLSLSSERLQGGANIISDTFGFSIGETELAKTPIAVSGRVLAYPYEDRNSYKPGDAVCAAPNGTVSKMTREEIREYPDRIIGTVSSVPNYETWGTGNVPVNGRIWIKVK